MPTNASALNGVPVAREVFEYEMVPWIGREYAAWLRTAARPHSADPHRLVLIPERIYKVFQMRKPGERVTQAQLEAMQYPRLPDEDELEAARLEQRLAALTGDTRHVRELHQKVEALEDQVAVARRALESWQRADPVELEERIAHELATAPHADVLVGIPSEAKD
jgi:DNA repair ATPase RecN